jgi:hypothetical protein
MTVVLTAEKPHFHMDYREASVFPHRVSNVHCGLLCAPADNTIQILRGRTTQWKHSLLSRLNSYFLPITQPSLLPPHHSTTCPSSLLLHHPSLFSSTRLIAQLISPSSIYNLLSPLLEHINRRSLETSTLSTISINTIRHHSKPIVRSTLSSPL